MFSWLTRDQLSFIFDMTSKNADAWVEKKYPDASSKEKKQKANELKILSYTSAQKLYNLDASTWKYKTPSKLLTRLLSELDAFLEDNEVSQMYLQDAAKWFSFWVKCASERPGVIKDYETYLDVMRNNECTENLFHRNGPMIETNKE